MNLHLQTVTLSIPTDGIQSEQFFATHNDRIVGIAKVDPWGTGEDVRPHIHILWVDEKCRRRGVGRYLIKKILSAAAAAGNKSVDLFVHKDNANAQALYESLGFTALYRIDNGAKIVMNRDLTDLME